MNTNFKTSEIEVPASTQASCSLEMIDDERTFLIFWGKMVFP